MELDAAQLSSITSSVGELAERITTMAEGYQGSPRESVAADLFDVERNLQAAHRRLRALVAKL